MSTYTTQNVTFAPFSQWTLNGCAISGGNLIIDPAFIPASPIASATGYSKIGGYSQGYATYADLLQLNAAIQATAESPDAPFSAVSMAAIGQIVVAQSLPQGCAVRMLCSYDSGQSWHVVQNGSWWPGMVRNGPFLYNKVRLRLILTTQQQGITPVISGIVAYLTARTLSPAAANLPSSTTPCLTASQPDFVQRLKAALPARWFGSESPVLDGVLGGSAAQWLATLQNICALHQQTRLQTAQAPFLDIAAWDFYGPALLRHPGETDAAFRARLRSRLFQPVVTRYAVQRAVELATGNEAEILEISRPADCGGYGAGAGYTAGGHYGSLSAKPFQAFVTAYRPKVAATGGWGGYGAGQTGYSDAGAYGDLSAAQTAADAAIYAAIEATRPAATQLWVRILSAPLQYGPVVPL